MNKFYSNIVNSILRISDELDEIAANGESTSFFPVSSYTDLYLSLENFRKEVAGVINEHPDFNYDQCFTLKWDSRIVEDHCAKCPYRNGCITLKKELIEH